MDTLVTRFVALTSQYGRLGARSGLTPDARQIATVNFCDICGSPARGQSTHDRDPSGAAASRDVIAPACALQATQFT